MLSRANWFIRIESGTGAPQSKTWRRFEGARRVARARARPTGTGMTKSGYALVGAHPIPPPLSMA